MYLMKQVVIVIVACISCICQCVCNCTVSDYVSIASPSLTDYSESPLVLPPVLDTIHPLPPPPVNDFLLYIGNFSSLFIIINK